MKVTLQDILFLSLIIFNHWLNGYINSANQKYKDSSCKSDATASCRTASELGSHNGVASDSKRKLVMTKQGLIDNHSRDIPQARGEEKTSSTRQEANVQKELVIVDMLSIGSLTRPEYQDAQERTMGTHASVRNYFRVNERNDTETECHTNLTVDTLKRFAGEHCSSHMEQYATLSLLKPLFLKGANPRWLMKMKNPLGWLCAQKRPIDGLQAVLTRYADETAASVKTRETRVSADMGSDKVEAILPDYLIIMDDDTWIHLDSIVPFFRANYPSDIPYAVAGCLHREPMNFHNFTFPCGGFSSIFTKAAVMNLMRPVYCDLAADETATQDDFARHFCWRLRRNQVGEKQFYRPGMSVADLMYAYSSQQPFLDPSKWGSPGYCMHSDVALAYFINFYNIPVHTNDPLFLNLPEDRFRAFNGSLKYHGVTKLPDGRRATRLPLQECLHSQIENCTIHANFCHYVTPDHMWSLFASLNHS